MGNFSAKNWGVLIVFCLVTLLLGSLATTLSKSFVFAYIQKDFECTSISFSDSYIDVSDSYFSVSGSCTNKLDNYTDYDFVEFFDYQAGARLNNPFTLTGNLNFGTILYRAPQPQSRNVTVINNTAAPLIGLTRTFPENTTSEFTVGELISVFGTTFSATQVFSVQPVFGLNADGSNGRLYSRVITVSEIGYMTERTTTAQLLVMPRTTTVPIPSVSTYTSTSITLDLITTPSVYWYTAPIPTNAGWTTEYRLYASDGITILYDWQTSNVFAGLSENTVYRARARFVANDADAIFPQGRNHITAYSDLTGDITTSAEATISASPSGKTFAPNTVTIQAEGNNIIGLEYFVLKTTDSTVVTESSFSNMHTLAYISGNETQTISASVNGIYWVRVTFANGATAVKSITIDNIYTQNLFVRGVVGNRELFHENVQLPHGLPLEYDGSLVANPTLGFVEVLITARSVAGYAVLGTSTKQILLNCISYNESPNNTITFVYQAVSSGNRNFSNSGNITQIPPEPIPREPVDENIYETELELKQPEEAAISYNLYPQENYTSDNVTYVAYAGIAASQPPASIQSTTISGADRRFVTFALQRIENTSEELASSFRIISKPSQTLRFYRGEIPAFSFGEGITYTILFRTTCSPENRVFASGISASEPFIFYNTKDEIWTEITLLFESVPSLFARGNIIYFTFEVIGEHYYHRYGLFKNLHYFSNYEWGDFDGLSNSSNYADITAAQALYLPAVSDPSNLEIRDQSFLGSWKNLFLLLGSILFSLIALAMFIIKRLKS